MHANYMLYPSCTRYYNENGDKRIFKGGIPLKEVSEVRPTTLEELNKPYGIVLPLWCYVLTFFLLST